MEQEKQQWPASENNKAEKTRLDNVTRIAALILAFVSVFYFFIKLLFL
jgi:hypothetical protein